MREKPLSDNIDWAALCSGAESVYDSLGASYTRFYRCTTSIRHVFGGHGFDFSGAIDFGGQSGSATINKTSVPGLSGYYGYKTQCKVAIIPNSAMLFTGCGFQRAYTPGSDPGRRLLVSGFVKDLAVGTDGYIYAGVGTGSSDSVDSWQRLVIWYPGGFHMLDH